MLHLQVAFLLGLLIYFHIRTDFASQNPQRWPATWLLLFLLLLKLLVFSFIITVVVIIVVVLLHCNDQPACGHFVGILAFWQPKTNTDTHTHSHMHTYSAEKEILLAT